jgi:hypothetical protein
MESHLESGHASENTGTGEVRKWLCHAAKSRYPVKSLADEATRFLDSARNDVNISIL